MKMFLLGLLLGQVIGGTVTIILYACIIIGRKSEENLENNNKCE